MKEATPAFGHTAPRLREAIESLDRATSYLQKALASNDPNDALAGATPYLRLFALAQGGAALADAALAANALMASGDTDPAHAGRIALCRFFAENVATGAHGLENSIMAGAPALQDAPRARELIEPIGRTPMSLKGKTLFITGASRGIGLAIGLRAARDGANVAVAAKTAEPHPKLPGTIYTAAEEIEAAGGKALPLLVDVRDEEAVKGAIDETTFGGLDIVVNNASAISLTPTTATDMKRFDLMHQINTRGTYMVSKYAIPHLEGCESAYPHAVAAARHEGEVVRAASRLRWRSGMSLCAGARGRAAAARHRRHALWPRTTIATSAIRNLLGGDEIMRASRTPDILADAAYAIFNKPARSFTGQFLLDDTFLAEGEKDFAKYRVDPTVPLAPDFFVPDDAPPPPSSST